MIFLDTWAWLALVHKRDPYHFTASRQHRSFQKQKGRYVTTDYVLSEFMAPLFGMLNFAKAQQFMLRLFHVVNSGQYQLYFVTPTQFQRAWQLRQKYHDKPDISFVDFTSMVVMQDLGITDVFTGDAHFQQVNLGFRLHP